MTDKSVINKLAIALKDFENKLSELASDFGSLETQYRNEHHSAIDIEDIDTAMQVQEKALRKIRSVKVHKAEIEKLTGYVNNYINDISTETEQTEAKLLSEENLITNSTADTKESFEKQNRTVKKAKHKSNNENASISDAIEIEDNKTKVYTGKSPTRVTILGKDYDTDSWCDVLLKTCEVMLLKKPYIVAGFDRCQSLNSDQRTNFSYIESDIKFNKKKLTNGLWIEANRNSNDVVAVCKKILSLCEYDENELIIECN